MRLMDLRLSVKFLLATIALVLLTALSTGITAQLKFTSDMQALVEAELSALRENQQDALNQYLDSIRQDLRLFSSNDQTRNAVLEFTGAWQELGDGAGEYLKRLYVLDNPYTEAKRRKLDNAGDGSTYSKRHERYHPWFRSFLEERGYYDIFLFSANGDLVYTVAKEPDFGTNMKNGRWATSNLGKTFKVVNEKPEPGLQVFRDFENYEPSGYTPASFISTPIFDRNGAYIGVLAFQMPIKRINQVMRIRAGLGETGESYIVGQDLLMRTDSVFSTESSVLRESVDTTTVRKALAGETGVSVIKGYRGREVLSAYGALSFMSIRWAIIAEIEYQEVVAPIRETTRFILIITGMVLLVGVLTALALSHGISRPITEMTGAMGELAEGNLSITIPTIGRRDEVGKMANAMRAFKDNALKRQEAETALRLNQERVQSLADNLPEIIIMKDTKLRYQFVNKVFEEWNNISRHQIIGKTVYSVYTPEQAKVIDEGERKTLESGKSNTFEKTFPWPDGNTRTCIAIKFPIYSSTGTILGLGYINHDITERKRAEEERLRQSQKMDVLGQLTGSVAHDFNNVLTVLDCNIDLLKSQENLQEEQKNLLDNCIEAVELGSNLSNRLTKFARVEPLAKTRVDLNAWIDSFGELLNRSVGKGISIEYVLPADTMPVLVDATLLGVALLNLVTNARDAMPDGGKITVSLDKTKIDEAVDPVRGKDEKRTYALLQVSDTGTGMSRKIKERVFEAFFTTKAEGKGTGLGLSTVKDLAQSADGFVQIESEPGQGTIVKIFLPLHEEEVS